MPIRLNGLASGLDTEAIISELVSAYRMKEQKYEKAQKKLSWKQDAWKSLNIKIKSMYDAAKGMRFTDDYTMKTTSVSDSTKATITAGKSAVNGTQSLSVVHLAKSSYVTGGVITRATADGTGSFKVDDDTKVSDLAGYTGPGSITVNGPHGTTTIAIDANTKVSSLVSQMNQINGASASLDTTNQRIFASASETGTANAVTFGGDAGILKALGMSAAGGAVINAAQDSQIELNGATFTASTNKYSINGLTIDCLAETGASPISITTSTDTQGLYDKVKDFFSQYNSLINEMTSLYNAASAKGYEPLTSQEKDAMSDSEVEEWEAKIKSALFRRDDTLDGVSNAMINSLSSSYYIYNGGAVTYDKTNNVYKCNNNILTKADGSNITNETDLKAWADANHVKKYALSSFGIKTQGYLNAATNEQNAFHIDGDADDDITKNNDDKLLSMLSTDPDTVIGFMKQISSDFYFAIDNKMKATTLSSGYTVYNDKEMAQEYSDYTDTISDWEKKLTDLEDYYYKKFSAMESALASLQSQSSSLSSLLS